MSQLMNEYGPMPTSTPSKESSDAVLKTSNPQYCQNATIVRGYTFETKTGELECNMNQVCESINESIQSIGYQARKVYEAKCVINEMLNERFKAYQPDITIEDEFIRPKKLCSIFLGFTSNIVSSGLREAIKFLVKYKAIDCIVTTAGGIEEDIIKSLPNCHTFVGDFSLDGSMLRENGINRVGNLIIPNDNYCAFEDWIMPRFDAMLKERCKWSPSQMIERLGVEINNEDSICYWAAKNKIPIFCPALTDGSLGDMLDFHQFRSPGLEIDINHDIHRLNSFARNTSKLKTGAIVLGGGVAKHHIMNANLMRNGADYCVYINTASEFDGSDSGANPDEARSWGKLKALARSVKVQCDATLVFQDIVRDTFYKYIRNERTGKAPGTPQQANNCKPD